MNIRHFTYIADIVDSLIFAFGCSHALINAANPEEVTTLHFAELVKKYKPIEIEPIEEMRDFDREKQSISEAIYKMLLLHMSVEFIDYIFRCTSLI